MTKKISRRKFLKYTGTGAAGLWLASCAPAKAPTEVPTVAPTVAAPTPLPPMATPVPGGTGTLVMAEITEPELWDPGIASLAGATQIDKLCYDAPFCFEGWSRVNHLCEEYEFSEDGLTCTLKIREGVKFHDGTGVKASDVVFSWKRMLELGGPMTLLWRGIVEPDMIELVDDYTFKVTLDQPYGPLLDTLAWVYVVNEKQVMEHVVGDDYGRAWLDMWDAGSGPFTIAKSEPGERLTMARFPDYWRDWGEKYLDGIVMEVIREPATAQLAMEAGKAHMCDLWGIPIDAHLAMEASGATQILEYESPAIVCIKMNNQKYPTNNKHFRKACAYAFDYKGVVENLMMGHTSYVFGCYPSGFKFWRSCKFSPMLYRRDLDKARYHLRESGFDTSETLLYNYRSFDPVQRDYGLILQGSLAEVGIKIELEACTGPVFHERQKEPTGAAHFNRISGRGLMADPDLYCMEMFHSRAWEGGKGYWASFSFYKNERVNELLDEARFSVDQDARRDMYWEAQDIIYDEAPDIWVDEQHWVISLNKDLRGAKPAPIGDILDMSRMYFER